MAYLGRAERERGRGRDSKRGESGISDCSKGEKKKPVLMFKSLREIWPVVCVRKGGEGDETD